MKVKGLVYHGWVQGLKVGLGIPLPGRVFQFFVHGLAYTLGFPCQPESLRPVSLLKSVLDGFKVGADVQDGTETESTPQPTSPKGRGGAL